MENHTPAREEKKRCGRGGDMSGGVFGLAFIGALIYFIQQANTFWEGVVGFAKAVVWPAFAAYHLLAFLQV